MANLTIVVDDQVLKRARIRALEAGTSVNALLAEALTRYARAGDPELDGLAGLLALAERVTPEDEARAEQRGGREWRREDLYER